MTIPVPPSPTTTALERLLRRLPSSTLLQLADSIRKAALAFDRGRPDEAMTCLGSAAELLDAAPAAPGRHNHADALDLLDRARYDLQHGWHAAAYDCAARATRLIETLTTTREIRHVD